MASQVTVTGTAGPGLTLTAGVFTDVLSWTVDNVNALLTIVTSSRTIVINIAGKTTFTVTVSGGYTVAVS